MKKALILLVAISLLTGLLLCSGCSEKASSTKVMPQEPQKTEEPKKYTFSDYQVIKNKEGLYGFIIKDTGEVVIQPQYHNIMSEFQENYMRVCIGKAWGIIDPEGNIVADIKYVNIGPFSDGLAWVIVGKKDQAGGEDNYYGFINEKGEEVISPQFYVSRNTFMFPLANFHDSYAPVRIKSPADFQMVPYTVYVDRQGKIAFGGQKFSQGYEFSEGMAAVQPMGQKLYGFINTKGELAIPAQYSTVTNFSNGVAGVIPDEVTDKKDINGFYIDKNGLRDKSKPNPLSLKDNPVLIEPSLLDIRTIK